MPCLWPSPDVCQQQQQQQGGHGTFPRCRSRSGAALSQWKLTGGSPATGVICTPPYRPLMWGLWMSTKCCAHTVCMQPHGIALPNCNKYMQLAERDLAHLHGDQAQLLPWSIMAASLAVERGLREAARIHLQDMDASTHKGAGSIEAMIRARLAALDSSPARALNRCMGRRRCR